MTAHIDPRRLDEDIRSELGRLLDGHAFDGSVAIDRLEIGPLGADSDAGDLARSIARRIAEAIPGGAHGETET